MEINLPTLRTAEVFYSDYDSYFEDLIQNLKTAQSEILIEFYIFDLDTLGNKIIEILKQKQKEGLQIRILVDGVGSSDWTASFLEELDRCGLQARIYHPLPWNLSKWRFLKHLLSSGKFSYWLKKLNQRNHRKVVLIDQKTAWLGSANLSTRHLKSSVGLKAWRDLGIKIEGNDLEQLRYAFEKAWVRAWTPKRKPSHLLKRLHSLKNNFIKSETETSSFIRLNYKRNLRKQYFHDLLFRLADARRRVWIINAYFVPPSIFLKQLKTLSALGIEVKVMLARKTDVKVIRLISRLLIYQLIQSGVTIYEYLPRVLHAKAMMIDDWMILGSSNLNHRSFIHDLEVDVVLTQEKNKHALLHTFLNDINDCEKLDLKSYPKLKWWEKVLGKTLSLLQNWF